MEILSIMADVKRSCEIKGKVKIGKKRFIIFESKDDYEFVKSLEKALSDLIVKNLYKDGDEYYEKEESIFAGVLLLADYLKTLPTMNTNVFVEDEKDFYKFPSLAKYFLPIRSSIYAMFFKYLRTDLSREKFNYVKRKIESLISLRSI